MADKSSNNDRLWYLPQYNLFLVKERLHFSGRFYSVLASKWCILRLKDTVFITFMDADVCST